MINFACFEETIYVWIIGTLTLTLYIAHKIVDGLWHEVSYLKVKCLYNMVYCIHAEVY